MFEGGYVAFLGLNLTRFYAGALFWRSLLRRCKWLVMTIRLEMRVGEGVARVLRSHKDLIRDLIVKARVVQRCRMANHRLPLEGMRQPSGEPETHVCPMSTVALALSHFALLWWAIVEYVTFGLCARRTAHT